MIGYALATAFAAPVEDGMMLAVAARPARQSLPFMEPSTVSCDAVVAWTVVMRPCLMPNLSLMTFTIGARPFVVQDAFDTTFILAGSYSAWLTPTTIVGVSASLAGAEMITFFAPPSMCFMQPSVVVKAPVDSQTYSTPVLLHGISVGSRVAERVTSIPLILRPLSVISTVPSKRPWTVSCSSWYFMYSGDIGELMCFTTNSGCSIAMRTTWRPMRPKPLTPSFTGASGFTDICASSARAFATCARAPSTQNIATFCAVSSLTSSAAAASAPSTASAATTSPALLFSSTPSLTAMQAIRSTRRVE